MEITVAMLNGTQRTMVVPPDATVGSLKALIETQMGVPAATQRLAYDNCQRVPLTDDTLSLQSYGLRAGSRVSLLITQPPQPPQPATIEVFLRNERGQTSTYRVKPDETVNDFKKKVEHREGVPAGQQRLVHQSREMMTGTLADYGVKSMSTIDMMFRLRGGGGTHLHC
ncbi:polyubiquitin-B [Oryzias melastigma]|uniref:ISG15 ubiquitin like modifier n=1 Tax=Oryzias melastigma TaxID=30732 RepID=A0A3B3CXW1_ORYME|nr:polyubiquitin-B [Oryzias melastigma]